MPAGSRLRPLQGRILVGSRTHRLFVLFLHLFLHKAVEALRLKDMRRLPLVGPLRGTVQTHIVGGADASFDLHANREPVGVVTARNFQGRIINQFSTSDGSLENINTRVRPVVVLQFGVNPWG